MGRKRRQNKLIETPFGSRAWVARAIHHKFAPPPEGNDEQIATMADYINYRKLHGILWPRKTEPAKVIWVEPVQIPPKRDLPPDV